MKHQIWMLGLLMSLSFIACHKGNDCLPSDQIWQIKERSGVSSPLKFYYNSQRLLTQLTMQFAPGIGPNFKFTYDQLNRPLTQRDSTPYFNLSKFVYQYGKLIRIDKYADSTTVSGSTLFTYDNLGRIILKVGDANYYNYVRYEYEGLSRNFKRALYYNGSPSARVEAEEAAVIEEYTYDNRINPYKTLPNWIVTPFGFSDYWGPVIYEPIPDNNPIHENVYGRTDTGYFKFMEYNFNYIYEHNYPVNNTFIRTNYFTAGGSNQLNYTYNYAYYKLN